MSGHSKWNNIKRTKEKSDAVKGKIFTKMGREIAVIVKMGGADPNTNSRLKDAITKAKQNNMPNETIQRSIKKASGELASINYEEITYEGYGVGGVAVMVRCLTDNKNRTAGDVRHAFDKFGGSLGSTNCVSYLFKQKGLVVIETKDGMDIDEFMLECLDMGARDIVEEENYLEIETETKDCFEIAEKLTKMGYNVIESEVKLEPENYIELDAQKSKTLSNMIEKLEDSDDVQEVSHNAILIETEEE